MSVAFEECEDSPSFQFEPYASTAQRRGLISWSDYLDFIDEIFPPNLTAGTGVVQRIGVQLSDDLPFLRAKSITAKAKGTKITGPDTSTTFSTLNQFEKMEVTINYYTPQYSTGQIPQTGQSTNPADPVPYLSHEWTIGGEFITVPGDNLQWPNGDKVEEDVSIGQFVPTIEHGITWDRVPTPPFDDIRSCIGKVNSATVTFKTGQPTKETLLFLGCGITFQVMTDGTEAWKLQYKFSEKRVTASDSGTFGETYGGWNHYRRDFGSGFHGWYKLTDGSTPIYRTADFTALFPTQ